jgi:hypothetical protein
MTRLRRARLAGALVALGIVVLSRITPGLLIQRAVLNYRSSRPRSLISPAAAGQVERRSESFGARKIDALAKMTTALCAAKIFPIGREASAT